MLKDDMIRALDPVKFSEFIGIVPDPWQAEVLRSEERRLLLNCCRQSGKSTTCATKALHKGLYSPRSLILCVSPSLRQSQELFRKVKDAYNTMDERPGLLEDNKLSLTLMNGSRIISLPGDHSTIRGYSGVTLILADEAAQIDDELFNAIQPMLITSNGALIVMSTPYGQRGFFHKEWTENANDWKRIAVTATDCPRISAEDLEKQRRSLGDMFFEQEYMCKFVETTNTVFGYDLIQAAFDDDITPLFAAKEG